MQEEKREKNTYYGPLIGLETVVTKKQIFYLCYVSEGKAQKVQQYYNPSAISNGAGIQTYFQLAPKFFSFFYVMLFLRIKLKKFLGQKGNHDLDQVT